jgi:hypothetical protein
MLAAYALAGGRGGETQQCEWGGGRGRWAARHASLDKGSTRQCVCMVWGGAGEPALPDRETIQQ